jgi:hypothetical protein
MLPIVRNGLVLELHFNELAGSTVYDLSGNNNNGTIYGATRVQEGFGRALSFDGIDDYVLVPDSVSLRLTSSFTIMAWIYPKSAGENNYGRILAKYSESYYSVQMEAGTRVSMGIASTTYAVTPLGSVPFNTWSHIAFTFDKTLPVNQIKAYVNGVLKATGTRTTDVPTSTDPLYIGNRVDLTRTFDGLIDEVCIYNRALSEDEIKAIYNYYMKKRTIER